MNDESRKVLEDWFQENIKNPYPNSITKIKLANKTNLNLTQVSSWLNSNK